MDVNAASHGPRVTNYGAIAATWGEQQLHIVGFMNSHGPPVPAHRGEP